MIADTLLAAGSALAGAAAFATILAGSRVAARRRARRVPVVNTQPPTLAEIDADILAELLAYPAQVVDGDELLALADAAGVVRESPGVAPAEPITLPPTGSPWCGGCGRPIPYGRVHVCDRGADYRPQRTVA